MNSYFNFERIYCSMSGSNLICIQVSQEAVKVVWYSYLFKNFPQSVMIHTVKGFSIVNEAEVDIFLEFPYFFYDPMDVGSLVSLPFLYPACTSEISQFIYCLKPSLKVFE